MNASALLPRDLSPLPSKSGSTGGTIKLPEPAPLNLPQLSTPQLRVLAAHLGLESADASRPVVLKSLRSALSRVGKQQWVVQNAEVSHCSGGVLNMQHL